MDVRCLLCWRPFLFFLSFSRPCVDKVSGGGVKGRSSDVSKCRANQRIGYSRYLAGGDMEVLFPDDCGDNDDVMEHEG